MILIIVQVVEAVTRFENIVILLNVSFRVQILKRKLPDPVQKKRIFNEAIFWLLLFRFFFVFEIQNLYGLDILLTSPFTFPGTNVWVFYGLDVVADSDDASIFESRHSGFVIMNCQKFPAAQDFFSMEIKFAVAQTVGIFSFKNNNRNPMFFM